MLDVYLIVRKLNEWTLGFESLDYVDVFVGHDDGNAMPSSNNQQMVNGLELSRM